MTATTRTFGLGLALLLAACGGSSASHENAAATTGFTYGTAEAASSDQAGAMAATVAGLDAFKASPSPALGMSAVDGAAVTGALLTGGGFASFSPGEVGATGATPFDVPACATVTAGKATFSGCRVTVSETSGGSTTAGQVVVNGSISVGADGASMAWDLTYRVNLTMTTTGTTIAMAADLHAAGKVAVTATTASGTMNQEVGLTATVNGQAVSAGVDESLAFDVTRDATCGTGVTGGALEAKRVWTSRPSGATAADLPDQAVKVTWTGCGTATVQAGGR